MQGFASLNLAIPYAKGSTPFHVPARPSWQLKGRHGVFGSPVSRKASSAADRAQPFSRTTRSRTKLQAESSILDDLFFKLSWRDEKRPNEAVVIATAKERARRYLPHPKYILDHLPDVIMHAEYDHFSTRHIRESLGLDTEGCRMPAIMVMKKLQSVETLGPQHFRHFIWQIIRCE